MEFRFGSVLFTSRFDSGNLARIERVFRSEPEEKPVAATSTPESVVTFDATPDYEFNLWTKPDCAGTPFENGNRSWFHFGVQGVVVGKLMKLNIMNLNRQNRLYNSGYGPVVRNVPSRPKWERLRDRVCSETVNGDFQISFTYRFIDSSSSTTYFAFAYSWSYENCLTRLSELDEKFSYCKAPDLTSSAPNTIYYYREMLCESLEGRRVELVTISDHRGIDAQEEPRFDGNLFPDKNTPRCRSFTGKKVYFVSSRVHPGETPGSFVFTGFLDFILRDDDPRAIQLRKQYVFKLIPILNPDGVVLGHYRTDSRGVNLNRVYLDPRFDLYPSIYAAKSLLVFYHVRHRTRRDARQTSSSSRRASVKAFDHSWLLSPEGCFIGVKVAESRHAAGDAGISQTVDYESIVPVEDCLVDNSSSISMDRLLRTQSDSTLRTASPRCASIITGSWSVGNVAQEPRMISLPLKTGASESTGTQKIGSLVSSREAGIQQVLGSKTHGVPSTVDFTEDRRQISEERGVGNEGSDEEACEAPLSVIEGVYTPHLCDSRLRDIAPADSGIAFYVDLHGHASKRGCFIYGNHFEDIDTQVENMLFPRLIAMNTAHFDFNGCNFSEKNMYTADRNDGAMTKEGSGRVSALKALGIIHSYTLECNYNTGRVMNSIPPATDDHGRATPPPLVNTPPKYSIAHYEEVGKAMAIAGLDMTDTNPWSRISLSEFMTISSLREYLRRFIRANKPSRHIKGMPRNGPTMTAVPRSKPEPTNIGRATTAAAETSNSNGRQAAITATTGVNKKELFRSKPRTLITVVAEPRKTLRIPVTSAINALNADQLSEPQAEPGAPCSPDIVRRAVLESDTPPHCYSADAVAVYTTSSHESVVRVLTHSAPPERADKQVGYEEAIPRIFNRIPCEIPDFAMKSQSRWRQTKLQSTSSILSRSHPSVTDPTVRGITTLSSPSMISSHSPMSAAVGVVGSTTSRFSRNQWLNIVYSPESSQLLPTTSITNRAPITAMLSHRAGYRNSATNFYGLSPSRNVSKTGLIPARASSESIRSRTAAEGTKECRNTAEKFPFTNAAMLVHVPQLEHMPVSRTSDRFIQNRASARLRRPSLEQALIVGTRTSTGVSGSATGGGGGGFRGDYSFMITSSVIPSTVKNSQEEETMVKGRKIVRKKSKARRSNSTSSSSPLGPPVSGTSRITDKLRSTKKNPMLLQKKEDSIA